MNFVTKVLYPHKISPLLSSSISQVPFENQALQFWKVFFDFGYYLLLIPFRFKWDRNRGVYLLHSNGVQKICCLLSSLFGGLYYILKIRQKFSSATNESRNPAMYFELAYYFCDTLYLLIMFAAFGQKGHEIARVFLELQESNKQFYSNPFGHYKTRFLAKTICNLCLLTLVLYFLEIFTDSEMTLQGSVSHFENDAFEVFKIFWTGSPHGIFTTLSIFSNCLERILNAFSDILFVMTVLVFRELVMNFRKTLRSEGTTSDEAMEHYRWLRDITVQINQAMSLIIGSFIIGNLPFYATNVLDTFRDSSNIFMRLRYLFYCTYFFPALFLAAKSSKEVEEIRCWIYKVENHSQIDKTKLKVVLHEISGHNTVGLSSFGCITVTYGLFGTIVSLILTYALLKTQVQGPSIAFPGAVQRFTPK